MAFNLAFSDAAVTTLVSLLRPATGGRMLGPSAFPHTVRPRSTLRRPIPHR